MMRVSEPDSPKRSPPQKTDNPMQKKSNRRTFLKQSAAGAGLTLAATLPGNIWARQHGANDAVNVAVVGLHGRGKQLLEHLLDLDGARVVAICDPDQAVLDRIRELIREKGKPEAGQYRDYRKLLEDARVDAVLIATPNHWHALMGVWACQAGKDVYVEKPVSHHPWEGRRLVEAARKYKRVVQSGTQNRSDDGFRRAAEYLWSGKLGPLQWVHGIWYKRRGSIGNVTGPRAIPETIDYDLWTGPAPMRPLLRERLHYDWHWQWAYGDGDMGNTGPHQMDDCIWIMQRDSYPERFFTMGGRFGYVDDGETPNTHLVVMDYRPAPLIVEIRNLPHETGAEYMDNLRGIRMGNVFQCEGGSMVGGRGGAIIYDREGRRIEKFPGDGGATHVANWLDAIRRRDPGVLRADIAGGAFSADLCHLANLAYRAGSSMSRPEWRGQADFHEAALSAVDAMAEHLERNGVDTKNEPITTSPWMTFDPERFRFTSREAHAARVANALLEPVYRAPFVVPARV